VLCKHEVAGSNPVTSTKPNLSVTLSIAVGTVSREEVEPGVLIIYRCQGAKPRRGLVARLIQIARNEIIHLIVAHILSEKRPHARHSQPLPFRLRPRHRARFPRVTRKRDRTLPTVLLFAGSNPQQGDPPSPASLQQ
jgi:hypothetical protein